MQNANQDNKYFWDRTQHASDGFKLKRYVEYAGFADLIRFPFDIVKAKIGTIEPDRLRTSEKRIEFIRRLQRIVHECRSWDDAVFKIAGLG